MRTELDASTLPSPSRALTDGASLFLDFDGTLVDIAARYDAVRVEARLHRLMAALDRRLEGRVAVVSGRPADEVRTLFGVPAFAIGGSHGLELYQPDGRVLMIAPRVGLEAPLAALQDVRQRFPNVLVEQKPFGLAVHYRLAPEAEEACRTCAEQLAQQHGLILQAGKMVIELRAPGADKGSAVAAFMKEPPMAGGVPIFVGDDQTDEAGFAMAAQLGGAGVLVGAPRNTCAAYRLGGVEETLCWLEDASGVTA